MYGYDLDDDIDHVQVGLAAPYVLVAKDHRLAGRKRVAMKELAEEPMVLLDLPHSSDYLEHLVESTGFRPVVRHRTAGFETVRAMVADGLGWSVLNQRPTSNKTYDGAEVVPLEIKDKVAAVGDRAGLDARRAPGPGEPRRSSGPRAGQRVSGQVAERDLPASRRTGGSDRDGCELARGEGGVACHQVVGRGGDGQADDPARVRAIERAGHRTGVQRGVHEGDLDGEAEHVGHDRQLLKRP